MRQSLYLMLGYPGSGKTTTSQVLQKLTGAVHIWADAERLELFKTPSYSHTENIQLYDHLNEKTDELLSQGNSVIYDTSFNFFDDRKKLREIAAKSNVEVTVVWVKTVRELAKKRATEGARLQPTRVLGNMAEKAFEHMSSGLEAPHYDEKTIVVDGTKVTPSYIKSCFNL